MPDPTDPVPAEAATGTGLGPADTGVGAALRFVVEVAAWVVIARAVGSAVGGLLTYVLVVAVLIGVTATFNAEGDKRNQGVVVPGPVRLALEAALAAGLIIAAAYLWGGRGLLAAVVLAGAAAYTGRRRYAWLLGRWEPQPDA